MVLMEQGLRNFFSTATRSVDTSSSIQIGHKPKLLAILRGVCPRRIEGLFEMKQKEMSQVIVGKAIQQFPQPNNSIFFLHVHIYLFICG